MCWCRSRIRLTLRVLSVLSSIDQSLLKTRQIVFYTGVLCRTYADIKILNMLCVYIFNYNDWVWRFKCCLLEDTNRFTFVYCGGGDTLLPSDKRSLVVTYTDTNNLFKTSLKISIMTQIYIPTKYYIAWGWPVIENNENNLSSPTKPNPISK